MGSYADSFCCIQPKRQTDDEGTVLLICWWEGLRIAIIGCGLSGSLLAYFLPRMGHEVEVYEYNADPRVVCGGGISIDALRDISIRSDLNPE